MSSGNADALGVIRDLLVEIGGFLRNVQWTPGVTCGRCAGIPSQGYTGLSRRSGWDDHANTLDQLGLLTYAFPGHQTEKVMFGYKARVPAPANTQAVAMGMAYAIHRHWPCIERAGPSGGITNWAIVPSLRQTDRPHPLRAIVSRHFSTDIEIAVNTAIGATTSRGFHPDSYVVPLLDGAAVLLMDDTWTTGAHMHSLARALKTAGARSVTGLVMARWLDPTWRYSKDFIQRGLVNDYDPDLCPFTGQRC